MGEKKRKEEAKRYSFLFEKRNYRFMLLGIVFIAVGFILMAGGGSEDPSVLGTAATLHMAPGPAPAAVSVPRPQPAHRQRLSEDVFRTGTRPA